MGIALCCVWLFMPEHFSYHRQAGPLPGGNTGGRLTQIVREKPPQFAGAELLQFLDELNRFAGFGGGSEDGFFVGFHYRQPMGKILRMVGSWFG